MYNAAVWLCRVKETYGEYLDITWRHFSLEQMNNTEGPNWRIWDQPEGYVSRSFLSLRAGEAARMQGITKFERFHLALLTARHSGNNRIPLNEIEPLVMVAKRSGLDIARFRKDMTDQNLLNAIRLDHTNAVENHGIFGTPTFVFDTGNSVYLKTFIPPAEDAIDFFEHFVALMSHRSYLGELKRPQPPWPQGALR